MRSCPNLPVEPVKAMSTSFTCHFKVTSTLKLRLVLSGFFHNLPLSFQIFAIICSSASVCKCQCCCVNFIDGYLILFYVFTPPPSEWLYWCLFSIRFVNAHLLLAPSLSFPFFVMSPLYYYSSDCTSILTCKTQARIQVLCMFFFFFYSVYFASSELGHWLLELLTAQDLPVYLISSFFGFYIYCFSHPLNLSGGKLNFPGYNLLLFLSCLSFYFHVQTLLKFSESVYSLCLFYVTWWVQTTIFGFHQCG